MSKLSKETKIDEVLRVIYSSKSKTTLTKNQVKARGSLRIPREH